MTAPRPTEAACQRTIVHAAKLAGWMVHAERPAMMQSGRWSTPAQGDVGFPDLVLVHPARRFLMFVELKRKPYKLTFDQGRWIDALGDCAHTAVVYVPEEMDGLLRWLADAANTSVR